MHFCTPKFCICLPFLLFYTKILAFFYIIIFVFLHQSICIFLHQIFHTPKFCLFFLINFAFFKPIFLDQKFCFFYTNIFLHQNFLLFTPKIVLFCTIFFIPNFEFSKTVFCKKLLYKKFGVKQRRPYNKRCKFTF